MSDYSESGTRPVDDAAVADPPTEAEVRAAQDRRYPQHAATRREGGPPTVQDLHEVLDQPLEREPEPGQLPSDTEVQAERQAEGVAADHAAEGDDTLDD